MKIHWGHKLVFFAVSFMLFILGMVWYISRESVELVAENYYEKGINYQQEIDKFSAREGRDFSFTYDANAKLIRVHFVTAKSTGAKINCYRASDSKKDKTLESAIDADGNLNLPASSFDKGLWKLTCEWIEQGKEVAFTKEFYVQ